jgi:hypothetical protein
MPAADVIRNICNALAAMGMGNFCSRPMSPTMPRSLVKMSTALRGL